MDITSIVTIAGILFMIGTVGVMVKIYREFN
jgi:NADH:ubiquinone oxidoreductase subunit K